jgi:hypothetical protein
MSVAYIPDGATLTCPRARIKAKLLHRKRKENCSENPKME